MAQSLAVHAVLPADVVQFSTPMSDGSQQPVTPAPEDAAPSSDPAGTYIYVTDTNTERHRYAHRYTYTDRQTDTQIQTHTHTKSQGKKREVR